MIQATKTRKKVLFLITKATSGGAQRYLSDIITGLPGQFEPLVAYGSEGHLSHLLEDNDVPTHKLHHLGRDVALVSDIMSFFEMLSYIREVRPDVIHLNSSKAAALGALAARIAGVPTIVFTAHGWPFKEDRNPVSRAIIYVVSWFTAVLSHHVVTVTNEDTALGMRMWGVASRIVHIPIGIASFDTLSPGDAFTRIFGTQTPPRITTSTLRLITIAELTRNKGIPYAIEAVAKLAENGTDCIYVIAGSGEDRAHLESVARTYGVSDRIFLLGFVEDARQYLSPL